MRFSMLCALCALSIWITGCGSSTTSGSSPTPTDTGGHVAAGDIPDTANYLTYAGSGYRLEYVEGWGLHLGPGHDVTIGDKDSSETVHVLSGNATPASFATSDLARVSSSAPHFHLVFKHSVSLPIGQAIRAQYQTLSPQDPVTGKRVPVLVDRYYLAGTGKHAILTLATPVGVDNVDAFRRIAESFRWA